MAQDPEQEESRSMAHHRFMKLEELEDRHPGLCRQVEAMFKAFIPLRVIAAALQAGARTLYSEDMQDGQAMGMPGRS